MKTKRIFSLMGATLLALGPTVLAAGHGGGGGFGGGGFAGGGHFGGGGGFGGGRPGGGAFHSSARGFGGGRPAYFYSRGMHFAQPSTGQFRSAGHMVRSSGRTNRGITNSPTHSAQPSQRATLNGRTDHISERHSAANWHSDWDRRHSHFFHNRFFVFDDGFWFGLDPGFFPWDYYPYYAYDYYPYDYYPGYYADVEPYYYDEGVYASAGSDGQRRPDRSNPKGLLQWSDRWDLWPGDARCRGKISNRTAPNRHRESIARHNAVAWITAAEREVNGNIKKE